MAPTTSQAAHLAPAAGAAAQEARRVFTELCAFDEHGAARRELLASGVGEARVTALYGDPYIALTAGLISHIEYVAEGELLKPGYLQKRQTYEALSALPEKVFNLIFEAEEANSAELRAAGLAELLSTCIAERFADVATGNSAVAESNLTGTGVAGGIYVAHWLQANRALLPQENQVAADELMVAVARTIGLWRHLARVERDCLQAAFKPWHGVECSPAPPSWKWLRV